MQWVSARPGSANEKRRLADQRTVFDLPHQEVRDVCTANDAEPPFLRICERAVAEVLEDGTNPAWSSRLPTERRLDKSRHAS